MTTIKELSEHVVIPREEYEDLIVSLARVDSLMDLVLSDNFVSIPTICRILGRPSIARQVEERDEEERKKYAEWVKERGDVRNESQENNR